jgi:MFS transporter, DHA1 family, inner membrane transport protein
VTPMSGSERCRTVVDMHLRPAATLFVCLFAAQAGFLTLAPILPEVAREFGVETSTAGQLRAVSGVAGAVVALSAGALARRVGTRDQLLAGCALLMLGSLGSAAAPSFALLATAQVALGAGFATVLSTGIAAAAEWTAPERRSRVLAWALLGQPAAWVLGMPVIGFIADLGWRWTWLIVPTSASAVAVMTVAARPKEAPAVTRRAAGTSLWKRRRVALWATGELLAYTAWAGTLVFSGALFVESYGLSPAATGAILGGAALGYFPGTLLARRHVAAATRPLLVGLGLASALAVSALGMVRPVWWLSALVLATAMGLAGGRTIAGSAFGLDAAPKDRVGVMGIRAASVQLGYLLGAGLGGAALAAGGYDTLGALLGMFFLLAVVPHLTVRGTASRHAAEHRRSRRRLEGPGKAGRRASAPPISPSQPLRQPSGG